MRFFKTAALLSFFFLCACSEDSFQVRYIEEARKAADKTQYMVASDAYTRAFNVNQKNENAKIAIYELATMYMKSGDLMKAQETVLLYITCFSPDDYLKNLIDLLLQYHEKQNDMQYFDFWAKQYVDSFGTEETKTKMTAELAKRKMTLMSKMYNDRFDHPFYKWLGKKEDEIIKDMKRQPDRILARQQQYDKVFVYGEPRIIAGSTSDSHTFFFKGGVCKKVAKTIRGTLVSAWQYYPMLYKELTMSFAKRNYREMSVKDKYYIEVIWSFEDTVWTADTIQIPIRNFSVSENKEVEIPLTREEWRIYGYSAELRK